MKEFHFIDMHSHILPNVDDGAKDIEETRKMLQMAYDDGVREMVATPHFTTGRYYKKIIYCKHMNWRKRKHLISQMILKYILGMSCITVAE